MDKFLLTILSNNNVSNFKLSNLDNILGIVANKIQLSDNKNKLNQSLTTFNMVNDILYLNNPDKTTWIKYSNSIQQIIKGTILMIGKNSFYVMRAEYPLILKNLKTNQKIKIKNKVSIGRDSTNTLRLDVPNVSKHHANIFMNNNKYFIEDLNSINGIIVLPNKQNYPVFYDDKIQFGGKQIQIVRYDYGLFHDIGKRPSFEDTFQIINSLKVNTKLSKQCSYFAIFDGHSGKQVSKFAELHLHKYIESELSGHVQINLKIMTTVFTTAIQKMDSVIFNKKMPSGTTANMCIIYGNELYTANVGDSRSVLCRNGRPIALSFDHKPNLKNEQSRIEKNGGFVHNNRVNGRLAISRAIGDNSFKNNNPTLSHVISTPDITYNKLTTEDEFIVMACDGLWDVMSNKNAVDYIKSRLDKNTDIQTISKEIVYYAINELGSTDNVTCLIIKI